MPALELTGFECVVRKQKILDRMRLPPLAPPHKRVSKTTRPALMLLRISTPERAVKYCHRVTYLHSPKLAAGSAVYGGLAFGIELEGGVYRADRLIKL